MIFRDGKKLCKKNKVEPSPYTLKHYKDGEFHKDYDRRETVQSMSTFLRDPSGDIPWDEDEQGVDVVHINDVSVSIPRRVEFCLVANGSVVYHFIISIANRVLNRIRLYTHTDPAV